MTPKNIIVIGAGVAGLAAARLLAEAGIRVTLVESRPRIGGRIHTLRSGGTSFELGAEFIHGRPRALWQLIEEAGIETEELEGIAVCHEHGELNACGAVWKRNFALLDRMKAHPDFDCSFCEYLDREHIQGETRAHLISYVEGFNAADHRVIGVAALAKQQAAEDAIEGDRVFRLCNGYAQIPEFLAKKFLQAGGELLLGTQVRHITWRPGEVELTATTGGQTRRFSAGQAVITLPLGVLQQGSIEFSPSPEKIVSAARRLRMGHARRIGLLFGERFWASKKFEDMGFLFAFHQTLSTWWTQFPSRNGHLTAWAGGARADVLADWSADEFGSNCCEVLAHIFSVPPEHVRGLLVECQTHDWQRDPFSLGAYSYVPAGALSDPDAMTEPVERTLYFAGEHTDTTGHWGTVHAALGSGVRAATQILNG